VHKRQRPRCNLRAEEAATAAAQLKKDKAAAARLAKERQKEQ